MNRTQAVILAGGRGTRLAEVALNLPKPMVCIGGEPILWHIMKSYSHYGINEFIICLGYKGDVIKEWFSSYSLRRSDVVIDFLRNTTTLYNRGCEPWTVKLIDTGEHTATGGRMRRISKHLLSRDLPFFLTYGDGLADIDITKLMAFHKGHGKLCTMTSVKPPGRFGYIELDGTSVTGFREKHTADSDWINGGYFVLSPRALDYIDGDNTPWEGSPLQRLAQDGEVQAYLHEGFWQCMDTHRDYAYLNGLCEKSSANWIVWE